MTTAPPGPPPPTTPLTATPLLTTVRADDLRALLMLAGLGASVLLRVVVAGPAGAGSAAAGVAFATALLLTALASGVCRPTFTWQAVGIGLAGAGVLCAVPAVHRLLGSGLDVGLEQFPRWAVVVTMVAVAEELLLRGALFETVSRAHGDAAAILLAAAAFALLHVPIYGWSVLPLDIAVGVALGVLRVLAGSVTAPAIAHVTADLAGWFLR